MNEFVGFPKIGRLSRDCIITEKLDGTNAQVHVTEAGVVLAASKNRYITIEHDNYGFAKWVATHEEELRVGLGPGRHFGEWFGQGIQRNYGLTEKRFALFNIGRWNNEMPAPACCCIVPILYQGLFDTMAIDRVIETLGKSGSVAVPGFMKPEGIVVFHTANSALFKKTLDGDAKPKI